MQELYKLVYEKAVQHERHFQQNKRMRLMARDKPAPPKPAKDTGKAAVQSKKSVSAEPGKKFKQKNAERKVKKKTDKKKDKQPASRKEPPSPCPKCQEMHWLSDCTKATDAEKVVLREKLREASKARKSRTKRLKKLMPSTSRTVTINGILDLPCCPDTGSDHTVISRSQWKSLLEVDPTVQEIPLDTPVRSLAYGSHPAVSTKKALLHVLIHTAAGPVQPAEAVPCLIMDVDEDEFIIGRDLLSSLGIDVDRQLEQLASHVDDETSGDPFELEADELPANPSHVASDEEVRAAIEVLIERALKHGFPPDKVDKLRVIVHMFDVWRLELRDDPPARVPPLEDGSTRTLPVDGQAPYYPSKSLKELMDMRQTTDYREFNSRTAIMAAVMPILSLVMETARGKQHFGLFDFIKGFWQLPLAEFCQEWLSYMTDEKIYTPRRVPQGCGDAAIHFQKTMEKCFATLLYKHLLVGWKPRYSHCYDQEDSLTSTNTSTRDKPQQETTTEATELNISMLRPLDDANFAWPTFEDISLVQSRFEPPRGAERTSAGVLALNNRVWIPVEAKDLILRLFIIAHCDAQGHRGIAAMVDHIGRLFALQNLRSLASTFVRQCRLCLHSKGGNIIPRPLGETFDCSERNGLLHFDFLSMGDGFGDSKYILVLKNHASHFCELVVADTADSAVTVEAFLDWHSRFGLPPNWISDQGSHFKNEVVIRTMILEYKIAHRDWVYLIPMVQSSLNHTAVPSLGNRAPVELFTGLPCPTPLKEFYLPGTGEFKEVPACDKIDDFLDDLRSSIHAMHKVVEDQRLKQRMLNKKRERGENIVNFTVGDYVLRSRVDEKRSNKLLVTWVGPYRVVRADAHSFLIKHLITGAELDVHASRLKFYADSSLDVTEELLEHISSQGIVLAIEKFKSHRWNDMISDFEVLVQWKGLEAIEDSYEPLASLAKDVPILVNQYVAAADQELKAHWQRATTTGETRQQGQTVAPETVRPPDKSRRRSRRRRPHRVLQTTFGCLKEVFSLWLRRKPQGLNLDLTTTNQTRTLQDASLRYKLMAKVSANGHVHGPLEPDDR